MFHIIFNDVVMNNKKGIIGIIEYDQDINQLFKAYLEYYGYEV